MQIDFTTIHDYGASYILKIHEQLGKDGTDAAQRLLRAVTGVHKALSTERLGSGLLIGASLDDASSLVARPSMPLANPATLAALHDRSEPLAIQVRVDGQLIYWIGDYSGFEREGFVSYEFRGHANEVILTHESEIPVPSLAGQPSAFGVAYYRDLEDAFTHYNIHSARFTQCTKLQPVWREPKRLVFAPGPEHTMRDSLVYFLRTTLRGYDAVDVMPEQNVNATKPVDVKVSWSGTNRVALIEVKWLGMSAAIGAQTHSARWPASRALEGAQQLADYLDMYHLESPEMDPRGYVAVFDGRRRRVKATSTTLSEADATHFRNVEIEYQEEILARPDFAHPVRFFLEPAV